MLEKALADGHFSVPDQHLPGLFHVGQSFGMLNAPHVFNTNALRCRSLSDGMMLGRRLAQEYISFYRKYVPGCENLEHVTTGSLMGVRESRRIVGEYELNFADYLARRQFPDQIGVFNKAVDIHVYDNSAAEYQRYYQEYNKTAKLKPGECYGIPYGILVPKGWKNLWVAGRCNSSDVQGPRLDAGAAGLLDDGPGRRHRGRAIHQNRPAGLRPGHGAAGRNAAGQRRQSAAGRVAQNNDAVRGVEVQLRDLSQEPPHPRPLSREGRGE